MARWHFATKEEAEHLRSLPSVVSRDVEAELDPTQVYEVDRGVVRSSSGELVNIPEGMLVKLLDSSVAELWCYQVEAVSVWVTNGTMELSRGAPVALFHRSKLPSSFPTC